MKIKTLLHLLILSGGLYVLWSCNQHAQSAKGGFLYPRKIRGEDSDFLFYQLRDSIHGQDSMYSAYSYVYLKYFDEPYFSLKPFKQSIYRFWYEPNRGNVYIVSLSQTGITVKKGPAEVFYILEQAPLTDKERFHLDVLTYRFPIDTMDKSHGYSRSLDSIVRLYPELLNPAYYKRLLDKTIKPYTGQVKYSETHIAITAVQYRKFVDMLESAHYWQLPHIMPSGSTEGATGSFSLEANTSTRCNIVQQACYPNDKSKFTKACQQLLEMAKLGNDIPLIYSDEIQTVDTTR